MNIVEQRKYIEKIRPAMAYEYLVKNHTIDYVAKKFKCSQGAVRNAIDMFSRYDIKNLMGPSESFIIVDRRDREYALKVLESHGISIQKVEGVVYQEFQSSINNDKNE